LLFEAERHESLRVAAWDETRARETIARIVAEAERAFDPATLWPVHPLDAPAPSAITQLSLYLGAAGVIWAIDRLVEQGAVQSVRDWAPIMAQLAVTTELRRGFLLGRAGLALAAHRVTRDGRWLAQAIEDARANLSHESNELFVGTPGTLLVVLALLEQTEDARLAELARESGKRVLAELRYEAEHGCSVWTQVYFGRPPIKFVGLGHGFFGNALALLRAGYGHELRAEIERTVERTAVVSDGLANWPYCLGEPPLDRASPLVQLCHGAPGVIVALARLEPRPGSRLEELLRMGGELTWRAGPLAKGSNLCHGTAGNAYAFLTLFRRTGERAWLERARSFAMHAIGQWEAESERHGRGRFSLWTGDPGLACFLWDCVRERDEFPTLHVF
jgi:hypothetical protein